MVLELAEGDLLSRRGGYHGFKTSVQVRPYDRSANHVPGYTRRYPRLSDSSLFSFKLADGSDYLFITVPDPANKQAPRLVREDLFDGLSDYEYQKLIAYVEPFNDPALLHQAINNRLSKGLSDPIISGTATASGVVSSAFLMPTNSSTVVSSSIWDKTILGVPVKYAAVAAGVLFLLK